MTSDSASGKVVFEACGWYMLESLRSLDLGMVEMSRPSGAWISTVSVNCGWAVISKLPVGAASKSGLIG